MPLVLILIVMAAGGLYLVDQSQSADKPNEGCVATQCNDIEVIKADIKPLHSALENSWDKSNTSDATNSLNIDDAALRYSAFVPRGKTGGIEGTGFRPDDDKYSLTPPPSVGYDNVINEEAVAEGGIEGTGIYGDLDENFELLEHNSSDDYDSDEGGIEGTGILAGAENQLIAYGPITQFGSIYVNGTKYEIDDAELEFVNNTKASELSIGMMVQVQADWQQQTNGVLNARKVTFDHQIEGPINSVAHHGDITLLEILGTTVVVAGDTSIDRSIPSNFDVGAVVSVSGITDDKAQLLATYIALRSDVYREGQQVELENTVDSISVLDHMIHVNGMKVDVSQANWKQGNLETIEIAARVEIVGQYDADNNRIIAHQVRVKKNDLSLSKGNKFSVDTIVTRYKSIKQFRLNGYTANATEAEFLRGEQENLHNGARIRATGHINADGIFEIITLRIKPKSNFAVKTKVSSINPLTGEISFLNLKAYTQPDTIYQSKLRAVNKYFSINDIAVGDWIEIQGAEEDGHLVISNLFALRNKPQMILKGHVHISDDRRLMILGVEIQPTGAVSPELISSISDGVLLVAKGTVFDGDTFYARELIAH